MMTVRAWTPQERQRDLEQGDYLEITPHPNARRQFYFTVMHPFAADSPAPIVETVKGKSWIGVRVDRKDESDQVGLRRIGARKEVKSEQVETDAALFCVTYNRTGRPVRAFMRGGTYLKAGNQQLLSSPERASAAIEL
ncbi:MAG: hypothetical protein V1800_03935 [Candidatus Latescibacterota bacterium]